MEIVLKADNLSKNYYGKKALCNLNMEVKKGRILGLLGPNGSGKTTFMKIAAGLSKPSSGEILIEGKVPGPDTKARVSYLPDVNFLYKWMTIKDSVNFFNDFYKDFDKEKAVKLLGFMNLNEKQKVRTLSKGMLEKLNITLTMSRKAKLYILDEPLGGIDVIARDKIIDVILDCCNEESSMIISTHIVRDIERMFDEVAFISEGSTILSGEAEALRIERGKSMEELYKEVFE